jgi:hypothetical protein
MKIGKILLLIGIIIILAVSYYYKYYQTSYNIVTLEPLFKEFKKKPQDPGGVVIPYSNSIIYEQLKLGVNRKAVIYNVLSDPEEPLNIIYQQSTGDKLFSSIDEILDNIGYFEGNESDDDSEKYALPELIISGNKAEDQKNIIIQGTTLDVTRASDSNPKLGYLQISSKDNEGGYKIQLGAVFSENDARKEWENIKKKHSIILKDASLVLRKIAGKNERIFYLIMAGTYSSLSKAKLVCNKLSARHQNCIITK